MNGSPAQVALPATPRHLKRLSLSITPGQASSYAPVRLTPTSGGRRLLSLGGDAAHSPGGLPTIPSSEAEDTPVESTSLSTSSPVIQPASEGAWTTLPGTPSSPFSPGSAPRSGGGRSGGRASHSRGASSISYASRGNDIVRSPAGLGYAPPGSPVTSPSPTNFSRLRGDGDSLSPYQRQRERSTEGLVAARGGEALQLEGMSEESDGETVKARPEATSASAGAPLTIAELGGDLLSFIAKKERKCLDLREELKRHEDQLAELKKKWSTIVAKSLGPPVQASQPRTSTSENSKRIFARNTKLPLSASPSSSSSLLARDLAPATSDPSFDVDPSLAYSNAEVAESVQAAKAWVGGVFGKVLEAVGGGEVANESPESMSKERPLVALEEEEEPEEETNDRVRVMETASTAKTTRSGSISSGDEWRSSRRTMSSATSSSSFNSISSGGSSMGGSAKVPSESGASESTVRPDGTSAPPSPLANGLESPPNQSLSKKLPPRPRTQEAGHNRRRSTFDMLGSAAGGTLAGLGKRWAIVSQSETFKSGRAAVESTLDTFEKRLAETLGSDSEPVIPPADTEGVASRSHINGSVSGSGGVVDHFASSSEEERNELASWESAAPASAAAAAAARSSTTSSLSSKPTVKVETELDWSAFLDSPDPTPTSAHSPGQKVTAAIRSHPPTPTRATDLFDGSSSPLASPSLRTSRVNSPPIVQSTRTRTPPVSSPHSRASVVVPPKKVGGEEEWSSW